MNVKCLDPLTTIYLCATGFFDSSTLNVYFLPTRCRTYNNTDLTVSDDGREPYSNRSLRISSLAERTRTGL
jgi:hypothetical protein